jgi:hypothetical protein
MRRPLLLLLFLLSTTAILPAGNLPEATVQKKFISGGTIRLHLESGGYTITPSDSENIVVTYRAKSGSQLRDVKVEFQLGASSADVFVTNTPEGKFEATIEVPRHSNLWVRLTAGDLQVEDVEGDKNLEIRAGAMQVEIPHPEVYGHRDASVMMGSLESSAFDVSKGGMFRSFEQQGPGKYRLHAHVLTGDIDLRGSN